MKKFLDPNTHAVLDYAAVGLLMAAPIIFKFSMKATAASLGLSVVQLGLSLMTKYPLSVAKKIPFKVHGKIELATAIQMMGLPLLLRMNRMQECAFFAVAGAGLAGVWSITDYSEQAVEKAQEAMDEQLMALTEAIPYEAIDSMAVGSREMHQTEFRRAS